MDRRRDGGLGRSGAGLRDRTRLLGSPELPNAVIPASGNERAWPMAGCSRRPRRRAWSGRALSAGVEPRWARMTSCRYRARAVAAAEGDTCAHAPSRPVPAAAGDRPACDDRPNVLRGGAGPEDSALRERHAQCRSRRDYSGLDGDCSSLLAAKAPLRGRPRRSTGARTAAITSWTGITVAGTAWRVDEAGLGDTTASTARSRPSWSIAKLEWLNLYGNRLTGTMPAASGSARPNWSSTLPGRQPTHGEPAAGTRRAHVQSPLAVVE